MLDSQSINSLLLELRVSSNNERVVISDLTDLTAQIIFDTLWTSMNLGSKHPFSWNLSICVPYWGFYLLCAIEETSSAGIIWIVCHQDLRHPSEYWTSCMGKQLLATVHIAKLNKTTQSEVSELTSATDDVPALAIWKRHGSREITIVSSHNVIHICQFDSTYINTIDIYNALNWHQRNT